MPTACYPTGDSSPLLCDPELMASVLEGRHGNHAADVADFFATFHRQHGDPSRARAWLGVAAAVRRRTLDRLAEH